MTYLTDRPITSVDDDLLGRANFSKQLGKSICEYTGEDSLVVGLFGKWGTGKTSIINMVINEIKYITKDVNNKPFIIKFSPWNYSDKDNLIRLFFQSLINNLDLSNNEKLKKQIGDALNDYSWALDGLALIPIYGTGLKGYSTRDKYCAEKKINFR